LQKQLAVEIATRFKGEIVNGDAMQMYKGLPIITNKITLEEQRGIPHHLLGHIDLDQETWVVGDFKREANKIIKEIRSRGNLPIVVGGTHYYLEKFLFEDVFLGEPSKSSESESHPILDEPTEVILAKLEEVDPVMAEQWHPNDRRKIRRSLEIYLNTGRQASQIYAEQKSRRGDSEQTAGDVGQSPWQTLLFWVYSDPEVLKDRVTRRVDKMLDNGLLDETREMYQYLQQKRASGRDIDLEKGIWQSIGFKQLQPYHQATEEATEDRPEAASTLEKLKALGLEEVKGATRRYSKYQTGWIRNKLVPLLQENPPAMDHLFLVDSTDVSKWADNVAEPATSVTRLFLDGGALPSPLELSRKAAEVLAEAEVVAANTTRTPCRRVCDTCGLTAVTEEVWKVHLASHRHKRAQRKRKRRSLIIYEAPSKEAGGDSDLELLQGLPD